MKEFNWSLVPPVALALALGLGLLYTLAAMGPAIAIFILAVTVANAMERPVEYLARWMPRTSAVIVVFFGVLVLVALALALLVPNLTAEVRRFYDRLPEIAERLRLRIAQFIPVDDLLSQLNGILPDVAQKLMTFTAQFTAFAVTSILVVFLSLYWLLAMPSFERYIGSLFPPEKGRRVNEVIDKMGYAMGGFIRGTLVTATVTGTLTYFGLLLVGLDFALPLAGLMFLGQFIPYLGPFAGAVPGLLLAVTESPTKALYTGAVYLAIQQLEGQVLTPNIMRQYLHLPQWLVLLAIFAGGSVAGLWGLLIAVPLTGAIAVLVEEVAAPAFRRWTGADASQEQP